jgi:hypothetical protein
MPGTTSFPTGLDNNTNLDETLQDNVDEVVVAHIINAYAAIKALQVKVGITGSAANTTFDYLRASVLRQSGLNIDMAGTLDVTGAVTLDSTLHVVGAVDFDSTVNIDGVLTVNTANFDPPIANSGSIDEGVATTFARSDHNHGAVGISNLQLALQSFRDPSTWTLGPMDAATITADGYAAPSAWKVDVTGTGAQAVASRSGDTATLSSLIGPDTMLLVEAGSAASQTLATKQQNYRLNVAFVSCFMVYFTSTAPQSDLTWRIGFHDIASTASANQLTSDANALGLHYGVGSGAGDHQLRAASTTIRNQADVGGAVGASDWLLALWHYDGTDLKLYISEDDAATFVLADTVTAATMPSVDLAPFIEVSTTDGTSDGAGPGLVGFGFRYLADPNLEFMKFPDTLPV